MYCSRRCQERDFSLHKVECRELHLLFGSGKSTTDATLLIRNFLSLRQNETKTCKIDGTEINNDGVSAVFCGVEHFKSLQQTHAALDTQDKEQAHLAAKALWNQRKALLKSNSYLEAAFPDTFDELQKELEQDLGRFLVNNFGATDSMVRVCASGVFPLGALLNHSCMPNCILRYSFGGRKQQCPLMEIVAAQDIAQGDELTHSYVELIKHTRARKAELKKLYRFDCDCRRCSAAESEEGLISIPRSWLSLESSELARDILERYNPFTRTQERDNETMMLNEEKVIRPLSNREATKLVEQKLEHARVCMINGSLEDELACLQEANKILESAVINEHNLPLPSVSTIDLYKVRGERLGSLIVAGKTREAIFECEQIVAFLCLASHHLLNYSLLGLQLFTLGDLYEASGAVSKAKSTFCWARKIMTISHGNDSDMVELLNGKINQ
jgi:hypothetical protein